MARRRRHVIHGLLDQLKASFDGSIEQSDGVTETPRMIRVVGGSVPALLKEADPESRA